MLLLFQHDLLQYLGQRIATGVGGMFLGLGNRYRVRIKEVTHGGVSPDEYELAEAITLPALLEKPEQALHRDVHDFLRGFLAGGQVNDVGDSLHRPPDEFGVGNAAGYHLEAWVFLQQPVVAKGPYGGSGEPLLLEETLQ